MPIKHTVQPLLQHLLDGRSAAAISPLVPAASFPLATWTGKRLSVWESGVVEAREKIPAAARVGTRSFMLGTDVVDLCVVEAKIAS